MKRILISLLLLVSMLVSVLALSGCQIGGGNDVSGVTDDAVAYDGSEVTITFYSTMGSNLKNILEPYLEEFKALYPNITVEHTSVGDYDGVYNTISDEIAAGNQPNIAYCYSDHIASYNEAKVVLTLDKFIANTETVTRADGTTEIVGLTDEQKADFVKAYYDEGAVFGDGLMYSLPLSKSTEVLYYNKDFFESFDDGNGPLNVPTTWEEMEEVCARIKAKYPKSTPLGYDSEANWFITMCEQYGAEYTSDTAGDHFKFNNDTAKEFCEMIRRWYQKGYVTTEAIYGSYTSGLFTSKEETKSYMCIGSSAGSSYQSSGADDENNYDFEVGITSIPQKDQNNRKVISQGPSLCIFKDTNPQEMAASWLLVKFLTTTATFQAEFSMASGYAPVIKSASDNATYKRWLEKADGTKYIQALSVSVALSQTDAYFTSPAFNGSANARQEVGSLLQKIMLIKDDEDVKALTDKAFQDAIDQCKYMAGE